MRIFKVTDMDERPCPDPPFRDDELRRLVDLLPPIQRHLIERKFFGGSSMAQAYREVGLAKASAKRLVAEALETLRGWLENPPDVDPDVPRDLVKVEDVIPGRCSMLTEYGQCSQPLANGDLCAAHAEWVERDIEPDPAYERAIVLGEREPVQSFLSRSEMDALVAGRYRGDGRRLDQFTTADPLDREFT